MAFINLEFINLEICYEASDISGEVSCISTEGCAQESISEIVTIWTVVKPKEKGKDIIICKQNCSGISSIIRLNE